MHHQSNKRFIPEAQSLDYTTLRVLVKLSQATSCSFILLGNLLKPILQVKLPWYWIYSIYLIQCSNKEAEGYSRWHFSSLPEYYRACVWLTGLSFRTVRTKYQNFDLLWYEKTIWGKISNTKQKTFFLKPQTILLNWIITKRKYLTGSDITTRSLFFKIDYFKKLLSANSSAYKASKRFGPKTMNMKQTPELRGFENIIQLNSLFAEAKAPWIVSLASNKFRESGLLKVSDNVCNKNTCSRNEN